MNRDTFIIRIFAVVVIVFILNTTALLFDLYYILPWFDIVMHFLGGLFVGLSALWLIYYSGYLTISPDVLKHPLLTALFVTLAIGLLWEVFEVLLGVPIEGGYEFDTMLDIVMDAAGAYAAYRYSSGFITKQALR